jgi:hypothetical protein
VSVNVNTDKFKCPHCYRDVYVNLGLDAVEELRMKEKIEVLTKALRDVDDVLAVPAAEYVPAIPDAWAIIDRAIGKRT